jgi:hypothetical protein
MASVDETGGAGGRDGGGSDGGVCAHVSGAMAASSTSFPGAMAAASTSLPTNVAPPPRAVQDEATEHAVALSERDFGGSKKGAWRRR